MILSGWHLREAKMSPEVARLRTLEGAMDPQVKAFASQNCPVQPYLWEQAQQLWRELTMDETVLGVFLRGTDYTKLKPQGHYAQPSLAQAQEKIDEFLQCYPIQRLFLVTEDAEIYRTLAQKYGNRVFCSDSVFVEKYDASDYVASAFHDDPYERGRRYLLRLLLLSKCEYLVAGITNGSLFSELIRTQPRKAQYYFDLGIY